MIIMILVNNNDNTNQYDKKKGNFIKITIIEEVNNLLFLVNFMCIFTLVLYFYIKRGSLPFNIVIYTLLWQLSELFCENSCMSNHFTKLVRKVNQSTKTVTHYPEICLNYKIMN